MPLDLAPSADTGLTGALLESLLADHERRRVPQLERLWSYYRNSMAPRPAPITGAEPARAYSLAQEAGLPARLRRTLPALGADDRASQRELVIENDIAWRIDALVDFVFGKPVRIVSTARDEATRRAVELALDAAWEASGGAALFQDIALLGSVHGWVDLVLRTDDLLAEARPASAASHPTDSALIDAARLIRIEAVEAPRAIPLLDPSDYRRLSAYIIRSRIETLDAPAATSFSRLLDRLRPRHPDAHADHSGGRRVAEFIEVLSPTHRRLFEDGRLIDESENDLGELPVVHIQNASQPLRYEGLSDVEPLIPLQDELNTRLSDRAHRVTLQSFNMYLAKGLDGLGAGAPLRVAPGQVWLTDNPQADVKAFGGDGHSPSEDRHIEELRDAMDKISGVSPVAIGVIRAKLGHLSSENALRITLMGVLSKTARKRLAYGRAIARVSALVLKALDLAGVLRTGPADRAVRLEWSDPLPTDERSRLAAAAIKRDLGVPLPDLLAEIGHSTRDPGVV